MFYRYNKWKVNTFFPSGEQELKIIIYMKLNIKSLKR